MNTLSKALRPALADRRLDATEWSGLRPTVVDQPWVAGPTGRALLRTWARDDLVVEPQVRSELRAAARAFGYPVPEERPPGPLRSVVRTLRWGNVAEPDVRFERLLRLSGAPRGDRVTVAVVDTGTDVRHPAFAGKVDPSACWDFVEGDPDVRDPDPSQVDHGTHVFGLATAGTRRIRGVSLRAIGAKDATPLVQAIHDAARKGARIVNLSLGTSDSAQADAVEEAIRAYPGLLFVKSAGNNGKRLQANDPADRLASRILDQLAVVAAADPDGLPARYTNRGEDFVTHATYGTALHSTTDDATYLTQGATSQAAPRLANLAAKCLLLAPHLGPAALKQLLTLASDPASSWEGLVGSGGLVNDERALEMAALAGLASRGHDLESAADLLGLEGHCRQRAVSAVKTLVSPGASVPANAPRNL